MGTHKLLRGTHTTPSGKKVHAGESFNPTNEEVESHGEGRIVRNSKVFLMPAAPWLEDEEDEDEVDEKER